MFHQLLGFFDTLFKVLLAEDKLFVDLAVDAKRIVFSKRADGGVDCKYLTHDYDLFRENGGSGLALLTLGPIPGSLFEVFNTGHLVVNATENSSVEEDGLLEAAECALRVLAFAKPEAERLNSKQV